MSAAAVIAAARGAGVALGLDRDDLILEAARAPPPAVIARIAAAKPDLVAVLRIEATGWSAEDWRAFFDERAAIFEFDQDLDRRSAEAAALAETIEQWRECAPELDARRIEAALAHCGVPTGGETHDQPRADQG